MSARTKPTDACCGSSRRADGWLNVIFGVVYTLIILLTIPGEWVFYVFFGVVEMVLTSFIVWYAWTWPKAISKQ
jgi:hypothetical protein